MVRRISDFYLAIGLSYLFQHLFQNSYYDNKALRNLFCMYRFVNVIETTNTSIDVPHKQGQRKASKPVNITCAGTWITTKCRPWEPKRHTRYSLSIKHA